MIMNKHLNRLGLMACVLLQFACSSSKQYGRGAPPIDNDSYYSQPGSYIPSGGGYTGCRQINDAPSCGGG